MSNSRSDYFFAALLIFIAMCFGAVALVIHHNTSEVHRDEKMCLSWGGVFVVDQYGKTRCVDSSPGPAPSRTR